MSLSDLVESYEVIKLENRDEALIKTYPFGIFVTDNYILLNPDAISPIKLFTRKGQYVADIRTGPWRVQNDTFLYDR